MKKENTDKREAIVTTTLSLITKNGFDATPMSLIAKESGVAAGTIYLYFENKHDLINKIYLELKEELTGAVMAGFDDKAPVRPALENILRNYLKFMLDNPIKYKFFEQFVSSPYIDNLTKEAGLRIFYPIIQVFEKAKADMYIKNIPANIIYALLFAPVSTVIRQHINDEFQLTDELVDTLLQACWDSIKS